MICHEKKKRLLKLNIKKKIKRKRKSKEDDGEIQQKNVKRLRGNKKGKNVKKRR